jgi:hypothetical protein
MTHAQGASVDESWHHLLVLGPALMERDPAWALVTPQGGIRARVPYTRADTVMDAVRALQADAALPGGFASAIAEPLRRRPALQDRHAYLHPPHPRVRYQVHLHHTTPPPDGASTVTLPALTYNLPLAFLAALGILVLLEESTDLAPRLSWSTDVGMAQITAPGLTLESLHAHLVACAQAMIDHDQLLWGVTGFPPVAQGSGGDPLRVPINQAPALFESVERDHGPGALAWLGRIVNPHTPDSRGRAALTPFMAPRGRQSVRTFFGHPLQAVAQDPTALIWQALTGWRRMEGCTGENLDHSAPVSAAESPDGRAYSRGVPAATWLATQGLALTEVHRSPAAPGPATLWHTLPGLGRGRWHTDQVMAYPIWSDPLARTEVARLLREPGYRVLRAGDNPYQDLIQVDLDPPPAAGRWVQARQRGVFTVHAALRAIGDKSLGPLVPTHPLTTARTGDKALT